MSRIEELERRARQDPASIAFGALAEEYRRAGRLDEAVAACRTGLERHPSYLSARVTLGRALQDLGQHADARGEFEYVLSLAPDNLAAIRGLAELHGTDTAAEEPLEPEAPVEPEAPEAPQEPAASGSDALDLSSLDAALVTDAQRAAQIERLEIWLSKLEQARDSAHDRA